MQQVSGILSYSTTTWKNSQQVCGNPSEFPPPSKISNTVHGSWSTLWLSESRAEVITCLKNISTMIIIFKTNNRNVKAMCIEYQYSVTVEFDFRLRRWFSTHPPHPTRENTSVKQKLLTADQALTQPLFTLAFLVCLKVITKQQSYLLLPC